MIKLFVLLGFLCLFVRAQNENRGNCSVKFEAYATRIICYNVELDERDIVLPNPLPYSSILKLELINCSKKITEKSFPNLRQNITSLIIDKSTLDEFVLPELPELSNVEISHSEIPTLNGSFKNAKALFGLDLIENTLKLDDNSYTGPTTLKRLRIVRQNVTLPKLMLKDMKALRHLFLNEANIQSIPQDAFKENTELIQLDLSRNPFTTIEEGTFDSLKKLLYLFLSPSGLIKFDVELVKNLDSLYSIGVPARSVKGLDVNKLLEYCPNFKGFFFDNKEKECTEVQDLEEKLKNLLLRKQKNVSITYTASQ